MPGIRDIMPAILAQRSEVIDQALSAALPHARADELTELGLAMLHRAKANGVESLISEYHRLPDLLKSRLIERAEQFATSIRRAAGKSDAGARNALTIIGKSGSARLAYLVTSLCRHQAPDIREHAGQCITLLAERARSMHDPKQLPPLDAVSSGYLIEAIEQAVVLYSRHKHPALLVALLWLMPRTREQTA